MPERQRSNPLRTLALALIGVGVLLLATALLLAGVQRPAPRLAGQELAGAAAPAFTLADQDGQAVALSAQRGKAVTVSFVYSSCPDVCPLLMQKLKAAYQLLAPADRERAALLVVSVDPARDSQAARADYMRAQQIPAAVRFLGGGEQELERVWKAFRIGVVNHSRGGTPGAYEVIHTSSTYLIDGAGRERALLDDQEFSATELAASIRYLLR